MDKELAGLLRNSDQKALKKLFDLYHTSLCSLASTILKDKAIAKDIVQEVFIKVWRNRERLGEIQSWNAYLRQATVNTALNYLESSKRIIKTDLEQSELSQYAGNTTELNLAFDELRKKADQAIEQFPGRTRIVYTLIRSEEMSYREVAETLNISVKAVEKEMMKALKLLRQALREYLPVSVVLMVAEKFL